MILADTSIWVDHLRNASSTFADLLRADRIGVHPYIIGEVALGSLRNRADILSSMTRLSYVNVASPDEVIALIERHSLYSRGIGWVDVSLIAACKLSPPFRLWTRDRRLGEVCSALGVGFEV